MRILITGGAGFVGSRLALAFREAYPQSTIVALDNLRRRGAELNLPVFKARNIEFAHGDIRQVSDLEDLSGQFDWLIEASAEPSVLAGLNSSPNYLLGSNLTGTLNCLEFARRRVGGMVFLSTSRVYSIAPLRELALVEETTRFAPAARQQVNGLSARGVTEQFATHLPRSLYGATKLASEMVIQEYVHAYGLKAVINRCGVIAGPGQFGKVDQGVFTLWVAHHFFGQALRYTGFGGQGKQVRDLLHPADLFALIERQLECMDECAGEAFNIGGGLEVSTSLLEMTRHCQEVTGREVAIARDLTTTPVDIPWYISDAQRAAQRFAWQPRRGVREIVSDIFEWLRDDEERLRALWN